MDSGNQTNTNSDFLNNSKKSSIKSNIDINNTLSKTNKEAIETILFCRKTLTKKVLDASEKSKMSGIVYLSKIPPFMKPETIRRLLSQYGEIGRIFLAPEDYKSYIKRIRYKGNKKKKYTEGWVEFKEKKKAKLAADTLNTTIIGGKPGTYYHDDIWNIKYLPKFKWSHLQEQIASKNASQTSKLRAEISRTKRENQNYIKNYERGKMIENIKNKKRKTDEDISSNLEKRTKCKFKQRETIINNISTNVKNEMSKVLDKIF
ncbi:hypothetical protein T552_01707 [Pneumocystis carinii B80]|uniref:18S rRNA factor 2 n=1 Tax=Pneumocystis carinii (strain B80) TaxID=1408658 RepID=A0A0W4ZJ85_PNEC8|nr:hypothetical protein T552_01707 [Pneumocystis carinii B80]KTW28445.1 hypothetical protein T552_01707 [Pneumocystis carinii B80]